MEPIRVTYTFFKEGGFCRCEVTRGAQHGEGIGFWGGTDEATEAALVRAGIPFDWLKYSPIDVTVHDERSGQTKRYYQEASDGSHGDHDDQ